MAQERRMKLPSMLNGNKHAMPEHRYFPRLQLSIDTDIYRERCLLGHFKTRDISFDGICIETNGTTFDNNEVIGVRLSFSDKTPIQRGIVTHSSQHGTGLVLIDFSKEVYLGIYMLYKERQISLKRSMSGIESQSMKWQRLLKQRKANSY